jgi:hypothetical protein
MWTRCLSLSLASFALACTTEPGDTTDPSTTAATESAPGTTTQPTTAPATETGTEDTSTADTGTADTSTADTGTADTSTADTSTDDTGPAGLSFAADVYGPIIAPKCGCHMPGAGGMVMGNDATSAYAVIVGVASEDVPGLSRIEPGDPTASYLFHKISGTQVDVGGLGSTMPLGDSLTADQVMVIEQWILDGAQP